MRFIKRKDWKDESGREGVEGETQRARPKRALGPRGTWPGGNRQLGHLQRPWNVYRHFLNVNLSPDLTWNHVLEEGSQFSSKQKNFFVFLQK